MDLFCLPTTKNGSPFALESPITGTGATTKTTPRHQGGHRGDSRDRDRNVDKEVCVESRSGGGGTVTSSLHDDGENQHGILPTAASHHLSESKSSPASTGTASSSSATASPDPSHPSSPASTRTGTLDPQPPPSSSPLPVLMPPTASSSSPPSPPSPPSPSSPSPSSPSPSSPSTSASQSLPPRGIPNGKHNGSTNSNSNNDNNNTMRRPMITMPLSMQLMKGFAGMGCVHCRTTMRHPPPDHTIHPWQQQQQQEQYDTSQLSCEVSKARNDTDSTYHRDDNKHSSNYNNNNCNDSNEDLDELAGWQHSQQPNMKTSHQPSFIGSSMSRMMWSVSPLVWEPMMTVPHHRNNINNNNNNNNITNQHPQLEELILLDYMAACQWYGVAANAGVVITLRFHLPALRITPDGFRDADMLALGELLLTHQNNALQHIRRWDFSMASSNSRYSNMNNSQYLGRASAIASSSSTSSSSIGRGFGSHGAMVLAKVLQMSHFVQDVRLPRHRIGSYGASAIFIASINHPSLERLHMRRCRIGERGAHAFANAIRCMDITDNKLHEVDLSANHFGFHGCMAIEQALLERTQRQQQLQLEQNDGNVVINDYPISVDLDGNLILQEIMNGVTHCLGFVLALIGGYVLMRRVLRDPILSASPRHWISCAVYSTSLIVLFTSSTLYHSFFTMRHTKWIFEVMDKCAIYLLISGSYTPFLQIVLSDQNFWSVYLLSFIWLCCALGIAVEAFCPVWKYRNLFSLMMYLGMGWSAVMCLPQVSAVLPTPAMHLMVLGGVAYTSGVPFFVRNYNLDHAIWHLFVLAGSAFHWYGIYAYVAIIPILLDNHENNNNGNNLTRSETLLSPTSECLMGNTLVGNETITSLLAANIDVASQTCFS